MKSVPDTNGSDIFIAINKDQFTIDQLSLKLRNTAVWRTINLSGSDDLNTWYAIKENIFLEDSPKGNTGDNYQQLLNFPAGNYHYLKIHIPGKHKEPIAVLQAGIYRHEFSKPNYIKLEGSLVTQKNSAGISRIIVKFNRSYEVNKLHLNFEGQKYYRRNLRIYAITDKVEKLICETEISSSVVSDFYLSVKTNQIKLEIINGDNPALLTKSLTAYQLDQQLIAYLVKGQQYDLLFGDKKAIVPDYDLKFFGDSLLHQIKPLGVVNFRKNPLLKRSTELKIKRSQLG